MASVELKDLTKIYEGNTVVDHINLNVEDGSLVSILGPSGCGKTTTLRMIAGFEHPEEGDVLFDGASVGKTPVSRRNIGMVFQSYALFPHMTVAQNVAYGLEQHGTPKGEIPALVKDALERVHMAEYASRKPKQLSGGQQQRVALARALVIRPSVMLLDECLSALDKKLRVEMQTELRKLLEESKVTTFFVTHDQEEAMTLSDRIVVMHDGIIEQTGSPMEVYESPRNRFVADFLGKADFFEGRLVAAGDDTVTLETGNGIVTVPGRTDGTAGEDMLFAVRPEHVIMSPEDGSHRGASLKGTVESLIYSGNIVSAIVDCSGMKIRTEATGGSAGDVSRGSSVTLTWDPKFLIRLEK